jgi:hypothetical protein
MAIRGDAVASYEASLQAYKSGTKPNANGDIASFAPAFDDLVYGYWSGTADAATLRGLPSSATFTDLKSKKLVAFGPRSWEYILSRSPAEPGIARLRPNDDAQARYTAGGWGDGSPSQVLRQIGCETVILVTRRQYGSADFSRNLAAEFGAAPESVDALYDHAQKSGVTAQSIRAADGVWCTDWDGPATTDFSALAREGYTAPLLTSGAKFQGYSNVTTPERAGLPGCTAGVAPKD